MRGLDSYDIAMLPPSGEQIMLVHGDFDAVVTEVGATLRCLRHRSVPVIWEFPESEIASGCRGQVLAPWPNRLEDGSYRSHGVVGRADINEPERSNAIHGFVRWLPWSIEERREDRAVLSCVVHPQPAYPFRIRIELDYLLSETGLEVACGVTNTGNGIAPFGLGFHPYLDAGKGGIDRAEIGLFAKRRLILDKRGLPIGDEPASGSAFDLGGRALWGLELDDCYTGLEIEQDGRWYAWLQANERRTVIWADAAFGCAMCYTGDTLGEEEDRRRAVAIEPMTCPPNALRTGEGVIELEEGEKWHASWGITSALD